MPGQNKPVAMEPSTIHAQILLKNKARDVTFSGSAVPDDGANSLGYNTRTSLSLEQSTLPPPPQSSLRNTPVNLAPTEPTHALNHAN